VLRVDINWDIATRVLAAVIPLVTAAIALARGPGAIRSRLKHDSEILEKLPAESDARKGLLEVIADDVRALREYQAATRNWPMFGFAIVTAAATVYATIWLIARGEWWSLLLALPVGFLATVLIYGTFESAVRKKRP
jgi:hypothetical protein